VLRSSAEFIDFQYAGRTSLRESPRSDGLCYADRKVGLGETFLWVGQTDVGEDIAAAFLDLNFLLMPAIPSEPPAIWRALLRRASGAI
jgi:hypothetical protein